MPSLSLSLVLQIVVGLGLLNVWLLRSRSATSYRGGDAKTLKEEFDVYGLPDMAFYVVGVLKVGAGVALLAGIWVPQIVTPAAAVVAALMLGALVMHVKVGDQPLKSLPAALMLLMSLGIILLP